MTSSRKIASRYRGSTTPWIRSLVPSSSWACTWRVATG
jgi:hypothetical protein